MKQALKVILILVIVGGLGLGGWLYYRDKHPTSSTTSTNPTNSSTLADPYSGWKYYSNTKYGVAFKYPANWKVEEVSISNPTGTIPVEFAANIKFDLNEKYNDVAAFEVHTDNLITVAQFYDKYFGQSSLDKVNKMMGSLKGKQSIQYEVTTSRTKTNLYLFSISKKTYSFRSVNEELNQQRSNSYWADFEGVFNSLTIN